MAAAADRRGGSFATRSTALVRRWTAPCARSVHASVVQPLAGNGFATTDSPGWKAPKYARDGMAEVTNSDA
jgi:phage gpG-like protein